jgi:hypothetical protein
MDARHSFHKVYYRWTGVPKRAEIGGFLKLYCGSGIKEDLLLKGTLNKFN